jgi:arylsulfatase A-like enzyme
MKFKSSETDSMWPPVSHVPKMEHSPDGKEEGTETVKSPNILMIVTDQQRRDTIGVYGSQIARTPAIDAMAGEGMTFDFAFTPCGLCSPTRSSLLTGVYPHSHQVLTNVQLHPLRTHLTPESDILCSHLKQAGYRLGYVGKWHVSPDRDPRAFGFEQYVSLSDYAVYRKKLGIPFLPESNNYMVPTSARDPVPLAHCRAAFLADNAIRMMEEFSRDGERPFFIRLDFHGPHMPMVIPEPYASMYDPGSIPPHPNFEDPLTGKPAVQSIKRQHWGTERMTWSDWQPLVARYYGEVSLLDAQVARVLESLERIGQKDNTVVIYTTDHGDTMGAHKIWNKDYTMYDEIYRVPFIVRWPGIAQSGSRCDTYIHHFLDLTPTLLEIAGIACPHDVHGRTLVPLLKGQEQSRPREAFCEFHGSHMGLYTIRMLQTDRYKYVFQANDVDELYDHDNDPYELQNVVGDPNYASDLKDLKHKMVDWMAATKDHLYNEWVVYWLTGDMRRASMAPGRMNTPW